MSQVGKTRYRANSLELHDTAAERGILAGTFNLGDRRFVSGDLRCDLHPRWNRTGDRVCFDALDTSDWTRQLFEVEIGPAA